MSVITIRETEQTETGFKAILVLNGQEYPITITDPFTSVQEETLEWYFEDWLVYPQLNQEKANNTADSVKGYGKSLFNQVFKKDFDAYGDYRQLRSNLQDVEIEITSNSPEFQALHWEAIQDPELPRPLAVDCTMIRRLIRRVSGFATVNESPTINVLVVTARPDEDKDVGYRTISRPLVELVENSYLRVNVEILRPGTYQALSQQLEAKGKGYYHIIHFDCHGALMSYENYQKGVERRRYFYQRGWGLETIEPYTGVKAFLLFEGDNAGEATPVEAAQLTHLLTGKGIPVCILNACQSGKQVNSENLSPNPSPARRGEFEDNLSPNPSPTRRGEFEENRETSLGSRLMLSGMQMVVAMGYSVTVSAAKLMMEKLYQHLFDGQTLPQAIRLSRFELFNNKGRKAYFNQTIDLEDWLLPVVYSNKKVEFNLREFTPEEEEKYWERLDKAYRFPLPTYGFIGRDLEILKIEKGLLKHNILLLQGMGGTGKSTLLNYLREWWDKTNYADQIFYFGYDVKAWTLEQIVFEIGQGVYGRFEAAKFQAMGENARNQKLIQKLRSESYILILDNVESITGQELAIQNTLSETERNKLKDFLERLVGGKTKVILGSRSGEEWLQERTFKNHIYLLQGLDRQSRSILAEKILEQTVANKKQIETIKADDNFKRLMDLLAGYPSIMKVTLENLKHQTPQEILEALEAGDINLDTGSEDKTKSLLKCVEYSHSNLSPEARQVLLCLAPFRRFIFRDAIPNYVKELQKLKPFQDYTFNKFDEVIQEAINWGLLSELNLESNPFPKKSGEKERLFSIQPVFPYFLQTKVNQLDEESQEGLKEGFKNHYLGLAGYYNELMGSNIPQDRYLGIFLCNLEYENLCHGLQICLQKQESIFQFSFCLVTYFHCTENFDKGLQVFEQICHQIESNYLQSQNELILMEGFIIFDSLAKFYLVKSFWIKTKNLLLKNLQLLDTINNSNYYQLILSFKADIFYNLGLVEQQLRKYNEAEKYYQESLKIDLEINNEDHLANVYHHLGFLAQEWEKWEEAEQYYLNALDIYDKYGNYSQKGKTYHHLGWLFQQMKEWEKAIEFYHKALEIGQEYGEYLFLATPLQNLGIIAREFQNYEETQKYYQQALEILIEYGDRYSQGGIYHCFGEIAEETDQPQEAKNYYLQALQIWADYEDNYSIETYSLPSLARLYQSTQDESILAAVASTLKITVEEVKSRFAGQNQEGN